MQSAAETYFRALCILRVNKRFLLPLHPQRELNDSRGVGLPAQVLQTSGRVRLQIDRVIEEVKEVGGKPNLQPLRDVKVLEDRKILVPLARPEVEVPRIPTQIVRDGRGPDRAVGKRERQLVVETRSKRSQDALRAV